ncbi:MULTISPECIES: hypothetical protein [Burkholderia]|uniref:Uncharacterized protein n=1 Tax=Burkholderia pyrrocinia TaxID=60550 RepID=A0A318JLH7_BURPY|nr:MULTISPECIES: hypothetical protein [Burkholderia]PXX41102.1 hypothetical protein NA66_1001712 [Burkholderia pyrrocinia]SFW58285.1 hypothetical protein SAMN03159384_03029 [Burkholderia sp. NFACC33-1]SFY11570.1 hypothetical protein SAMN03159408_03241 [Burkholderia sp. NFPP32]
MNNMAQAQWQASLGAAGIPSNAQMQKEWAPETITADTVRSLLEAAHQHMGLLEQETQRLGESLYPVRSAVPANAFQKQENYDGHPECLESLHVLIRKIRQVTENIQTLTAEIRI